MKDNAHKYSENIKDNKLWIDYYKWSKRKTKRRDENCAQTNF